jgi:hypothetical protein
LPTIEFNEAQLTAARAKMWHQDGEPLLTLEAARAWVKEMGLVLFAPRPQIAAPAASLVEATLGHANPAPSLSETEVARHFVARLVQEGEALPLHLLGEAGDAPDFVVSAQMFSYVFTLRGDKAWKLPPSATGGLSPLGLKINEALLAKGELTAFELASELGREVTEAAILRSLVELWSQLRVIPVLQLANGSTKWEPAARRFTKAIKAGANAGQPTALSALISLYLTQAVAANEDEIEAFLSPLTARSRVREVANALTGARQLETVVLEGKTLLHVPGVLPEFAPVVAAEGAEAAEGVEVPAVVEKPKKVGTGRIGKFAAEGTSASEFRGKPVKKFASAFSKTGPGFVKPSARFGPRADGKTDRDRRPFSKDGAKPAFKPRTAGKPTFTKPWEEDPKPRAKAVGGGAFQKFRKPEGEDRKPLGDREQAGLPPAARVFSKPKYERESQARDASRSQSGASEGGTGAAWKKPRSFVKSDRPDKPGGFAAKRPYKPRDAEGGERPAFTPRSYEKKPFGKKPFEKKSFGDKPFGKKPFEKKPGAFGAKRPYTPRDAESGERPAFKPRSFEKKSFEKRPFTKKPFEKKPYAPRTTEGGDFKPRSFEKKPFTKTPYEKKPFEKKPYAARSAEGGERTFSKPRFGGKKPGGFGRRTSFTPVDENAERTLPKRPYKPRAADADQRKFTKAPWTPTEDAGAGAKRKSFGGPKKFEPKKFGGKPGGFGAKRSGPPRGAKPAYKRKTEE